MRIANYFVGISQRLANVFNQFIEEIIQGLLENKYPQIPAPEGFEPQAKNLLSTEQKGLFTFASFDMAVTKNSLQNIENSGVEFDFAHKSHDSQASETFDFAIL